MIKSKILSGFLLTVLLVNFLLYGPIIVISYAEEITYDNQAPSQPTNLILLSKTDTTVLLEWTASTDNVGVTGYDIFEGQTVVASVYDTSCIISGLMPESLHSYSVKSRDAAGNLSAESNIITVLTGRDLTEPTPPSNLKQYAIHDTSVELIWEVAEDNSNVAGYEVYRDNKKIATTLESTFMDIGLSPNTSYNYYVKAYDLSGNLSEASNILSVTTIGEDHGNTMDSVTPLELGVEEVGIINYAGDVDFFSFTAGWTGTYYIESLGSTDVYGYLYDENGVEIFENGNSGSNTYNFSMSVNLSQGKIYYLKVKHEDSNGIGTYSVKATCISPITVNEGGYIQVSNAYGRSFAVRKDGSVWAWGDNYYGYLGDGTSLNNKSIPVKVQGLTGIKKIAAGTDFSLALKQDGTVWAWGNNYWGQIGDGTNSRRSVPV